jgi:hypothetical protein
VPVSELSRLDSCIARNCPAHARLRERHSHRVADLNPHAQWQQPAAGEPPVQELQLRAAPATSRAVDKPFEGRGGITVDEAAPGSPPATAVIRHSEITNYQTAGIVVLGSGSWANVSLSIVAGPGATRAAF